MTQSKLNKVDRAIQQVKKQLNDIGDIRPGSLKQQTRKAKTSYGAYWHLSYTHLGKGHTEYVRTEALARLKREVENYKRLKTLVDRMITLSIVKSKLRMEMEKAASG